MANRFQCDVCGEVQEPSETPYLTIKVVECERFNNNRTNTKFHDGMHYEICYECGDKVCAALNPPKLATRGK